MVRTFFKPACGLICLLASLQLASGETVAFSVEGASSYALRHNPELKSARLRIEEARGRLHQSGRLSNPELAIEYGHSVKSSEDSLGISMMQRFPLTRRLKLEKRVSEAELAAAEAEVHAAALKLATEVQLAAVKLLALRERRVLFQKLLTNSRDTAKFLTEGVARGEIPATESAQVEIDTQQLDIDILQLDLEEVRIESELRPLLGLTMGGVRITGSLEAPHKRTPRTAREERPDLLVARLQAAAATEQTELARANRWEEMGAGLFIQHGLEEDAPEGFERETMLGFQLSLPLPFWNRNQGKIMEAEAAERRVQQQADALAVRIQAETVGVGNEVNALAELIQSLDATLLPKVESLEQQLRDAYSKGQSSLTDVLRARDKRLLLQRQRADTLLDYHLARVRQAAATGSLLPPAYRKSVK